MTADDDDETASHAHHRQTNSHRKLAERAQNKQIPQHILSNVYNYMYNIYKYNYTM